MHSQITHFLTFQKNMENFVKKATSHSPHVLIDKNKNFIEISGKSILEDSKKFWIDIIKRVDKFLNQRINEEVTISLRISYLNTSATKALLKMLQRTKKAIKKGCKVEIIWYYPEGEDYMLETGIDYSQISNIPFEYKSESGNMGDEDSDSDEIKKLYLTRTDDTPEIILDPKKGKFLFSGNFWPINSAAYFSQVLKWFDSYFKQNQSTEITIEFKFDYLNTSSEKQVARLFSLIESSNQSKNVTVKWFYEEDDLTMFEDGMRFETVFSMKFEFLENINEFF